MRDKTFFEDEIIKYIFTKHKDNLVIKAHPNISMCLKKKKNNNNNSKLWKIFLKIKYKKLLLIMSENKLFNDVTMRLIKN